MTDAARMRLVVLHGALARFGGPYRLHVASPAEAVRALCYQVEGFAAALRAGAFRCVRGPLDTGFALDEDTLQLGFGRTDQFHIVPASAGAGDGKGVGKAIIGVALVGVALATAGAAVGPFAAGTSAFSTATIAGVSAGTVALVGAGLVVGGITQLISSTPNSPDASDIERPDQRPSFLFNGPVNVAEQGHPIPLVYGEMLVGSVVVSTGLAAEQIPLADDDEPADPETGAGGLEEPEESVFLPDDDDGE